MIDFRDFMQQAELDLERAMSLYKKEDYGFAAFSLQQGLEKYLKSYFLKTNLVENVKSLGHLQYSEVIDEAIRILDQQQDSVEESDVTDILKSTIKHYSTLKRIFSEIQNSHEQKIIFWKSSLNIKLNTHEENVLNGIFTKMHNSSEDFLNKLGNFLSSRMFQDLLQEQRMPDDFKVKLPQILSEFLSLARKGKLSEYNTHLENLMKTLHPYLYGSGSKSLSKSTSDFVLKMKTIEDSFQWHDAVLLTYPHLEIGRYPTLIGDIDSTELYVQHKDDLSQFLGYVSGVCKNIRSVISSKI